MTEDDVTDMRVFGLIPDGYEITAGPVSSVAEPDQYYWKIWFEGESVNGGLADSYYLAIERARHYRFMDIAERFRWDRDTRCWVRR